MLATHLVQAVANNVEKRLVGVENLAISGELDPCEVLPDGVEYARLAGG